MKTLLYGTKLMNPQPINMTLRRAADILNNDKESVVVELEPGDGTYYSLLIAPCWAPGLRDSLDRWGIPCELAYNYLHVTNLFDRGPMGNGWVLLSDGDLTVYDVTALSPNEWSQELLAWWLTLLKKELGR